MLLFLCIIHKSLPTTFAPIFYYVTMTLSMAFKVTFILCSVIITVWTDQPFAGMTFNVPIKVASVLEFMATSGVYALMGGTFPVSDSMCF